MEHYNNLISAARAAMSKCLAWKLTGTEERNYNIRDVLSFAMTEGGENERLEAGRFYVVSAEGAIGLANRYEYRTSWMFIPLEGEELEYEIKRLDEEIRQDKLNRSAQQSQPMMQPQGQPISPQPMMHPQGQPIPPQPMMQPQGQPIPPQPMMQPQGQPISPQPMMQPQAQPIPQQSMTPPPAVSQPTQPQGQQAGKKKFCIQCGHQLNVNAKFCPSCGRQIP